MRDSREETEQSIIEAMQARSQHIPHISIWCSEPMHNTPNYDIHASNAMSVMVRNQSKHRNNWLQCGTDYIEYVVKTIAVQEQFLNIELLYIWCQLDISGNDLHLCYKWYQCKW